MTRMDEPLGIIAKEQTLKRKTAENAIEDDDWPLGEYSRLRIMKLIILLCFAIFSP